MEPKLARNPLLFTGGILGSRRSPSPNTFGDDSNGTMSHGNSVYNIGEDMNLILQQQNKKDRGLTDAELRGQHFGSILEVPDESTAHLVDQQKRAAQEISSDYGLT